MVYQETFSKVLLPEIINEDCIEVYGDNQTFKNEEVSSKTIKKCFGGKMYLIITNKKKIIKN